MNSNRAAKTATKAPAGRCHKIIRRSIHDEKQEGHFNRDSGGYDL